MATPDEILALLETLVHAYPGKDIARGTFEIYIQYLSDLHPELLRRAVNNLIETSTWFPRVAEIRSQARRIAGYHDISNWEPSRNLLMDQFFHLEQEFFHHRILDPDAWLSLAKQFERCDRPHSAAGARRRLAIFQQILSSESEINESPDPPPD